ncbi:MAG: hypothetical protein HQ572_05930 [Candidatus Omnitrophica bacterium]|nr:hypothetical protein [Candidatus Omnitrophota bacterium]
MLWFDKLSLVRKIILTIAGILYALAILGNAYFYGSIVGVLGATLFFAVTVFIVFLWIK